MNEDRAVIVDTAQLLLSASREDEARRAQTSPHTFNAHARPRVSLLPMSIDGHYDPDADIVWLRFEGYDPKTVVGEETASGLREIDPESERVVGLEFWHASTILPAELLDRLPPPGVAAAA